MARKPPNEENRFGGSWSLEKLDCVESYLKSYLDVMKGQTWATLWYIDAFSGDGYQRFNQQDSFSEETLSLFEPDDSLKDFSEGSSLRAVRVSQENADNGKRCFDRFIFLELDEHKLNNLKLKIEIDYPDQLQRCKFIVGDVNSTLPKCLEKMNWKKDRALVFVDPFATELFWRAVESFRNTCCDVWLLFPLGSVLRLMPRKSMPPESWASRLDQVFGDSQWRSIYHETSVQTSLFDEDEELQERKQGIDELLEYACNRFSTIFPEVLKPAILRTSKNAPIFALFAMTSNKSEQARSISKRIAKHLLKKMKYEQG